MIPDYRPGERTLAQATSPGLAATRPAKIVVASDMGVAPLEVQTVFVDGGDVIRPFRWDVTRRSQLGSLAEITPPETYPEFEDDLLFCCAEVLSFAGDSDLVFVGRSPQLLFDLLSGLLFDTSWRDRLHLLNLSLSGEGPPSEEQVQVRAIYPIWRRSDSSRMR